MTDSRQHAESTTLQPCPTAAAVGNTVYVRVAWRVLAMLRRSACVGACHLPPRPTTSFFCDAAGCACPSTRNVGTFVIVIVQIRTHPYINVHRGSFLTSIFSVFFFRKIADDRQQTTCREHDPTGRTMCACRILSFRRRVAFVTACHALSSCSLVLDTCSIFYSKPHPTPHVPLLASWWSLRVTLFSKPYMAYGVKVLCVVCTFSTTDRSWARLYRVHKKCLKCCY